MSPVRMAQALCFKPKVEAAHFLGEAVDVENDLTEGVCYDYG